MQAVSLFAESQLFLFSLYRVLHMLSRACLVFCRISRKQSFLLLLLSPPGACPLSLLPGTFCKPQSTLRGDCVLSTLVSFNLMQKPLDLMGGVVTWSALFKELWRMSEVIRSFYLPRQYYFVLTNTVKHFLLNLLQ